MEAITTRGRHLVFEFVLIGQEVGVSIWVGNADETHAETRQINEMGSPVDKTV